MHLYVEVDGPTRGLLTIPVRAEHGWHPGAGDAAAGDGGKGGAGAGGPAVRRCRLNTSG